MGARYLTDLADVVRGAGLACVEYAGWPTRARGSGGYASGCPTHVMVHHTASGSSWDGQRDADYIATGDPDAPLADLYIDRGGLVWVIAAGATNTNGKGHDWWGGGVPDNSMNSYAIGIEAGNAGTGEPWPPAQLAAYRALVAALCARYSIDIACVRGHFEWTNRKIDPAGNSPYATGGASWDMNAFRADCALPAPAPEPEPTPEEDDDVKLFLIQHPDGAWYITDSATFRTYVPDAGLASEGAVLFGWQQDEPISLGAGWAPYFDQLPITCP